MGRWGGEEVKGQGIFGCAFAGIILLVTFWVAYKAYPAIQARADFEKDLNKIIRSSRKAQESEIATKIMEASKNYNLSLTWDDIELKKHRKDKYTPVIEATIAVRVEIDFGFGPKLVPLPPIVAEVTLIQF